MPLLPDFNFYKYLYGVMEQIGVAHRAWIRLLNPKKSLSLLFEGHMAERMRSGDYSQIIPNRLSDPGETCQ